MSYFEFTKGQVQMLVDAYEILLEEATETYYLVDGDAVEKAAATVNALKEHMGLL